MIAESLKYWYDRIETDKLKEQVFLEDKETGELFTIDGVSDYSYEHRGFSLYFKHRQKPKPKEHKVAIEERQEKKKTIFGWKMITTFQLRVNDRVVAEFDEECKALMMKDKLLEAFTWRR